MDMSESDLIEETFHHLGTHGYRFDVLARLEEMSVNEIKDELDTSRTTVNSNISKLEDSELVEDEEYTGFGQLVMDEVDRYEREIDDLREEMTDEAISTIEQVIDERDIAQVHLDWRDSDMGEDVEMVRDVFNKAVEPVREKYGRFRGEVSSGVRSTKTVVNGLGVKAERAQKEMDDQLKQVYGTILEEMDYGPVSRFAFPASGESTTPYGEGRSPRSVTVMGLDRGEVNTLFSVEGTDNLFYVSEALSKLETEDRRQILYNSEGRTKSDIAEEIGAEKETVNNNIRQLELAGLVVNEDGSYSRTEYGEATAQFADTVEALATAYEEQRSLS